MRDVVPLCQPHSQWPDCNFINNCFLRKWKRSVQSKDGQTPPQVLHRQRRGVKEESNGQRGHVGGWGLLKRTSNDELSSGRALALCRTSTQPKEGLRHRTIQSTVPHAVSVLPYGQLTAERNNNMQTDDLGT